MSKGLILVTGQILGREWVDVSLSHGTLVPEHLMEAFEELLPSQMVEDFWAAEEDSEDRLFILEEAFDYLNEIAPCGCYFGAQEGDSSDFGFWRVFELDDEDEAMYAA